MATYDVNIRSDRVELDLNTTSYNLSLSRVGAQGSAGTDAEDLRLEIWSSTQTYTTDNLVLEDSSQGAQLYRAIQAVPAGTLLSNTTYWQAVGEDTLTFNTSSTVSLTRTGDSVEGAVVANSIGNTELDTVNSNVGQFSNATVTVNAQGRVTAVQQGTGGGGGNQIPSEHASISLSSTELAQSATAVTITGNISVDGRYTFVGTGDDGGSAGNETLHVRDGDNNDITVAKVSDADSLTGLASKRFQFTVDATERQTAQTIRVYATVTATYMGNSYSATVSADLVIHRVWYTEQAAATPANLNNATNRGRLANPQTVTFVKASGSNIYIILPIVSGRTYTFRSGLVFLSTSADGTVGSTHTIYRLTDFPLASGGNVTVEISY